MEKWCITGELFLIIYYSRQTLVAESIDLPFIILFVLIYSSLKLLYYLIEDVRIRKALLFLLISYVISIGLFIDDYFLIFLPVNLCLLLLEARFRLILYGGAVILTSILINQQLRVEFVFIAALFCLYYEILRRTESRVIGLLDENDKLHRRNSTINHSLARDEDFEAELRNLSRLEERNRIAQEIHDELGHTMSGSLLQLEAVRLLIDHDRGRADDMLIKTIDALRDGMDRMRNALHDIKPEPSELGIHNLKYLKTRIESSSELKMNLIYDERVNMISSGYWKIILQNTREAVTNSIKYAECSVINIDIQVLNRIIRIEVADDGIGAEVYRKGLGITGIEERALTVNGRTIIDGSDGFSIINLLPID